MIIKLQISRSEGLFPALPPGSSLGRQSVWILCSRLSGITSLIISSSDKYREWRDLLLSSLGSSLFNISEFDFKFTLSSLLKLRCGGDGDGGEELSHIKHKVISCDEIERLVKVALKHFRFHFLFLPLFPFFRKCIRRNITSQYSTKIMENKMEERKKIPTDQRGQHFKTTK